MSNHCHPDLHCTLPCFAPLCVASQSNRICTRRMPSAERRLCRLSRLRLRLASRRRPRFVRGHCLSVFCLSAQYRSVFAIRFALRFEIAFSLCKARPESQTLLPIGATTIVGDCGLCAVIAFQCSAVQQIAVQCLQFALHCALKSRFLCARQGLKAKHCSQSVQAQRLAPILAKNRIDN